ncbi:MAG TPA: hypothetical protein VI603_15070, partial [Saprospiraceae bacterium]|nr:hypothetical protein [Saprospiraceae bacterium]
FNISQKKNRTWKSAWIKPYSRSKAKKTLIAIPGIGAPGLLRRDCRPRIICPYGHMVTILQIHPVWISISLKSGAGNRNN